jgi:hypothetical protein
MHQSKLIELLRKLSSRQLSKFEDFLASPYFNKNKDNILFFNFLKKYTPAFDHKNLSKDAVLTKAKISKPLDEKALTYLMSQQMSLLDTFLCVEEFLVNDFESGHLLLEQFHSLQLSKHYKSRHDKIEKVLRLIPQRNAGFFQKQLILKSLEHKHADPNLRGFNQRLQQASNTLDTYFIVEKLRYACLMENLATAISSDYQTPFLEEVLMWSAHEAYDNVDAIQVYRHILLLLRKPEKTEGFQNVKTLLSGNESVFTPAETKQLYTLLLNYCTRRINRFNDEQFLHEYLDINKRLLENELIFENGQLAPWRYANLVAVGLKTGQMEWTRDFIHRFKKRLPDEFAENMFSYTVANYHYHRGEHDEAQQALLYVDFANDVLLNVSARSLLIKIYFETDQTELLLSYLEATRVFLLRNKLLDAQLKRQLQKFVEYTAKLARYGPPEWEKLRELHRLLPPPSHIMHHDWVLTQLDKKLG